MNFDDDVWVEQIIPFVDKSYKLKKEIVAQLCKKDGKVKLGKNSIGDFYNVKYDITDFQKCDDGEYVGTIHVETIPHKPLFPSDDDVRNEFEQCRTLVVPEKGEELCLCSKWNEGIHIKDERGIRLMDGQHNIGCYCEKWTPWNEEKHKKIIEKIFPYAYLIFDAKTKQLREYKRDDKSAQVQHGIGWGYLYDDLIDLGIITNRQMQWFERNVKDCRMNNEGELHNIDLPGKAGMDDWKRMHEKMTGLPWRALDTHEKFMKLVKEGKIGRRE